MRELLDAELDVVGGGKRKHYKAAISVEDVNANVAVVQQGNTFYVGDDLTIKAKKGSTVTITLSNSFSQNIDD